MKIKSQAIGSERDDCRWHSPKTRESYLIVFTQ